MLKVKGVSVTLSTGVLAGANAWLYIPRLTRHSSSQPRLRQQPSVWHLLLSQRQHGSSRRLILRGTDPLLPSPGRAVPSPRSALPAQAGAQPCSAHLGAARASQGRRFPPGCDCQCKTWAALSVRLAAADSADLSPLPSCLRGRSCRLPGVTAGRLREADPLRAVIQGMAEAGGGDGHSLLRIGRRRAALPEKPERLRGVCSPQRRCRRARGCGRAGQSRRARLRLQPGGQAREAASAPCTLALPPLNLSGS